MRVGGGGEGGGYTYLHTDTLEYLAVATYGSYKAPTYHVTGRFMEQRQQFQIMTPQLVPQLVPSRDAIQSQKNTLQKSRPVNIGQ